MAEGGNVIMYSNEADAEKEYDKTIEILKSKCDKQLTCCNCLNFEDCEIREEYRNAFKLFIKKRRIDNATIKKQR